jgi:hypothetical protein
MMYLKTIIEQSFNVIMNISFAKTSNEKIIWNQWVLSLFLSAG